MGFNFEQLTQHYFPPSGFVYLNMLAVARPASSPYPANEYIIPWKIANCNGLVKSGQIAVGGMLTQGPVLMEVNGSGQFAVLVLHPVIAYHFIRERLNVVTNNFADLCDLMAKEGAFFRPQIEDGLIHSWQDEPILKFLLNRIGEQSRWQDDPIFHAVNIIITKKGLIKVRELAKQVCMSERNLERQFLEKVSVSPKTYANIWRFQYAIDLLKFRGIHLLGEIADQAGYYDIPHFIKDLKQKTGDGFEYFFRQTPELLQAFLEVIREK